MPYYRAISNLIFNLYQYLSISALKVKCLILDNSLDNSPGPRSKLHGPGLLEPFLLAQNDFGFRLGVGAVLDLGRGLDGWTSEE